MTYGRFTLQFMLYPKLYYFGFMVGEFEELDAWCFGLALGAGVILIGVKK